MGLERFDTVMSFVVVMLLLSMLVTIFVQCVVAVSGLRGWNLSAGVQQLIRQVDPGLASHARKIADAVLEHPSVAYTTTIGRRRKATAIRQQELIRIMKDLATAPPADWAQPTRDALNTAVAAVNAAAPPTETVVAELTKLFPSQAQAVEDAVNRGLVQMSAFEVKVGAWFDTVMDRTTDRFVLHTRWITAVCAFVLAIALQVQLFGNAGPADMQIAGIPITSGMLVAGLFLSLGAPFWFNALKQLANLRPDQAGKVDQE